MREMMFKKPIPVVVGRHFHFAPSALSDSGDPNLGRCPRLLHFAPMALRPRVLKPLERPRRFLLLVPRFHFNPVYSRQSDG